MGLNFTTTPPFPLFEGPPTAPPGEKRKKHKKPHHAPLPPPATWRRRSTTPNQPSHPPQTKKENRERERAPHGKANDDGKRVALDVKAGDRILFGKYAGQEITLDGEEYFIMKEDEVLAVIEGHTTKKPAATRGTAKITKKKKKRK